MAINLSTLHRTTASLVGALLLAMVCVGGAVVPAEAQMIAELVR